MGKIFPPYFIATFSDTVKHPNIIYMESFTTGIALYFAARCTISLKLIYIQFN